MSLRTAVDSLIQLAIRPLGGVFQWGTRAARHMPHQTALEKRYDYEGEVLIVGAGAAGLAAAYVLEQNHVPYTILEATDRFGGRLKEDVELADFPIDLGAEWIHNRPTILNVLTGSADTLSNTELIPYHLDHVDWWSGKRIWRVPSFLVDAYFRFMPEQKYKRSTWYHFVRTHFGERVRHRIRYGTPVAVVDTSGDRPRVTTTNGELFIADKVIVAVPIGILKSDALTFVPPLPEVKRAAIAAVEYRPGFKLVMKFSEKFYPDVTICGGKGGEKSFYDVAFEKEAEAHVLGLLSIGVQSEAYYALDSEAAILQAVLDELDAIFDGKASATFTGDYRFEDWGRHPFTRGTWVEGFRIDADTQAALNSSINRSVYFAGEAHDPHRQLGVPGAILAGFDAVDRLLRWEH